MAIIFDLICNNDWKKSIDYDMLLLLLLFFVVVVTRAFLKPKNILKCVNSIFTKTGASLMTGNVWVDAQFLSFFSIKEFFSLFLGIICLQFNVSFT